VDRRNDLGLRIIGVLVGVGATLPIGYFAFLTLRSCPTCQLSVVLGGISVALTIAVADGQAWGALAIACYGAGMALFYGLVTSGIRYATSSDAAFAAIHVAIGVLALAVAYGLARRDSRSTTGTREIG
jgi:hypothetical protein